MNLKELFLTNKTVVTDGAMGTYFTQLTGLDTNVCEKCNVSDPETIAKIHNEYLNAGAKIIRTNTFSANSFSLSVSRPELAEIISKGYEIASKCAEEKAVVCADVSVIYDNTKSRREISDEYRFIADTFIKSGAKTFIFETLPDLERILPAIEYIRSIKPDAEIIASFTILPDGCTRSGISVKGLLESIEKHQEKLTMVGLNCGCGAAQLFSKAIPFFSYIQEHTNLYTIIMPNSGYPSIENQRTVFHSSPKYFAQQTSRFIPYGISAVGGCCGTVPESVARLAEFVSEKKEYSLPKAVSYPKSEKIKAPFSSRLTENKFVIAAELDPPNTSDLSKMIAAAKILKEAGVDIITVSDSPLGHAKADSVVCSARIKREVGIDTLPHICCRDKNINALRSILLGAASEGIGAVLAVTGDHIAETDRGVVKPVFNVDSTRLMELISRLNEDVLSDNPIAIGGAYDPEKRKTEYSLKRLEKKMANGASFVLTQPVFSEEGIESVDRAREKGIKVLVGIMPMVSYRNATFMQNEVPGMSIPDKLVNRFKPDMTKAEATQIGIEIAVETARMIKPHADGFYFITPFNRAEVIKQIIENI